jgi:branched-chain amino acid transport system ATP-binding protein
MLDVSSLHSGYGRIPILNGINLSVKEGEVVGILGHNGMGKTTLLKTLMGEIAVTSGRISFDGKNITGLDTYKRSRAGLAYVPQGRAIFPELSVLENLKLGGIAHDGDSVIPEVLDHFPVLKDLLERPGRGLSGGQQQILALARCLVGRPKLVLLDEPTEGIQPSIVDLIAEKLADLNKALGLTILLVEQDLNFIRSLAQRILIIQKGHIISEISATELADPRVVEEMLGI